MAWKKKAGGAVTWEYERCHASNLTDRLQELVAEKWLVKYVFWDGETPGLITIVRMQSAAYAPNPAKVKA